MTEKPHRQTASQAKVPALLKIAVVPWGYESFKEIVTNRAHPDYEEMRDWAGLAEGEQWDAADFDIAAAKQAVSEV